MTSPFYKPGANNYEERIQTERVIADNIEAALFRSGEQVYANRYGYSDVEPYEVVRVISDKTIEVRAMTATKDPSWKPVFHTGGFTAHCSNQHEQRWFYQSNPDAPVERIRKSKKGWKKGEFRISDEPHRFYDYNF